MGLFQKDESYDNVPPARRNPVPQPAEEAPEQASAPRQQQSLSGKRYRLFLYFIAALSWLNFALGFFSDRCYPMGLFFPMVMSSTWTFHWLAPGWLMLTCAVVLLLAFTACVLAVKNTPRLIWVSLAIYLLDTLAMCWMDWMAGQGMLGNLILRGLMVFVVLLNWTQATKRKEEDVD